VSAHLGQALNAFVDGELDAVRENEVLTHLAWCGGCREEVAARRGFKAALRCTGPGLPQDLSARLMAVSAFPAVGVPQPVPSSRHLVSHVSPRLRRTAVSGAVVVLGLGGALSLAGPPPRQPVAPVDPTNAGFVVDHTTTSGEVPFTTANVVTVATQASASPAP
jgi:anti-sigma factor RsiW